MHQKPRAAFTLIELLVVIAVIAFLAAILFPVFARAREKAWQSACLSNLKQLGAATTLYAQDWDQTLPYSPRKVARHFQQPNASPNFLGSIIPYVTSTALFTCPSSHELGSDPAGAARCSGPSCTIDPAALDPERAAAGDACSGPDCASYAANQVVTGRALSVIPTPAEIVYLQEYYFRENDARHFPFAVLDGGYSQWYWDTSDNHAGGGNLLFVDEHAHWKRQESLRCRDFGLVPPDESPTFLPGEYSKVWSAAF